MAAYVRCRHTQLLQSTFLYMGRISRASGAVRPNQDDHKFRLRTYSTFVGVVPGTVNVVGTLYLTAAVITSSVS